MKKIFFILTFASLASCTATPGPDVRTVISQQTTSQKMVDGLFADDVLVLSEREGDGSPKDKAKDEINNKNANQKKDEKISNGIQNGNAQVQSQPVHYRETIKFINANKVLNTSETRIPLNGLYTKILLENNLTGSD